MKTLIPVVIALVAILSGCSQSPKPAPAGPVPKVQITHFYTSPRAITRGGTGNLCYGVASAAKVALDPPVQEVWPSQTRCMEIQAGGPKRYTLTATGADGRTDVRTVDIETAEAVLEPRLYDIWVNALEVGAGAQVKLCFKTENAVKTEAGPGTFYQGPGCLTDYPKATTTYKIAAVGKDGQRDSRSIKVKVR